MTVTTAERIISEATEESKTCGKCAKPFEFRIKDTEKELTIEAYCVDANQPFHMLTCPACGGTCIQSGNYYHCPACGWHT